MSASEAVTHTHLILKYIWRKELFSDYILSTQTHQNRVPMLNETTKYE